MPRRRSWHGSRSWSRPPGVHFELPASLEIALEAMPERRRSRSRRRRCAARPARGRTCPRACASNWPPASRTTTPSPPRPSGGWRPFGADDALRAISSLVEDQPGDAALARDVAFSAMAWGLAGQAYHLLRRAGAARAYEPDHLLRAWPTAWRRRAMPTWRMVYYELACGGQWDPRFGDFHSIVQLRLPPLPPPRGRRPARTSTLGNFAQRPAGHARRRPASARGRPGGADLLEHRRDRRRSARDRARRRGVLLLSTAQTAGGGQISRDVTTGYGPEMYILPQAPAGNLPHPGALFRRRRQPRQHPHQGLRHDLRRLGHEAREGDSPGRRTQRS